MSGKKGSNYFMSTFLIIVWDYFFFLKIVNISGCFFIYNANLSSKKHLWSTSLKFADRFQVFISYIAIKNLGLSEEQ